MQNKPPQHPEIKDEIESVDFPPENALEKVEIIHAKTGKVKTPNISLLKGKIAPKEFLYFDKPDNTSHDYYLLINAIKQISPTVLRIDGRAIETRLVKAGDPPPHSYFDDCAFLLHYKSAVELAHQIHRTNPFKDEKQERAQITDPSKNPYLPPLTGTAIGVIEGIKSLLGLKKK